MGNLDGAALVFRLLCRVTARASEEIIAARPEDPYARTIAALGRAADALDGATDRAVSDFQAGRNEPDPQPIKITVK